jgi:hypothetical protein
MKLVEKFANLASALGCVDNQASQMTAAASAMQDANRCASLS